MQPISAGGGGLPHWRRVDSCGSPLGLVPGGFEPATGVGVGALFLRMGLTWAFAGYLKDGMQTRAIPHVRRSRAAEPR